MNERIENLALKAGLLNYVDNETPRRYFIHGHADLEEVQKFAEMIVRECADIATINQYQSYTPGHYVLKHFGVE